MSAILTSYIKKINAFYPDKNNKRRLDNIIDILNDSFGIDKNGNEIYLKDLWPTSTEINNVVNQSLSPEMFKKRYNEK